MCCLLAPGWYLNKCPLLSVTSSGIYIRKISLASTSRSCSLVYQIGIILAYSPIVDVWSICHHRWNCLLIRHLDNIWWIVRLWDLWFELCHDLIGVSVLPGPNISFSWLISEVGLLTEFLCLQSNVHTCSVLMQSALATWVTGLIPGLCPANERRRYFVTMSFIGWVQA